MTDEEIEAMFAALDEWLNTTDHLYGCTGYSEGMSCCLDGEHVYSRERVTIPEQAGRTWLREYLKGGTTS